MIPTQSPAELVNRQLIAMQPNKMGCTDILRAFPVTGRFVTRNLALLLADDQSPKRFPPQPIAA